VLAGTWKSQDVWGGLKSKMVAMAPYTNMPADVKALAEKTEAGIKDGSIEPFKCPVYAQDGKAVECMQRRRPSQRRTNPRHELLRERDHRELSGEMMRIHVVMRGLDPRIHEKMQIVKPYIYLCTLRDFMDCRVKPGNDPDDRLSLTCRG
jgi:hypothetical protein